MSNDSTSQALTALQRLEDLLRESEYLGRKDWVILGGHATSRREAADELRITIDQARVAMHGALPPVAPASGLDAEAIRVLVNAATEGPWFISSDDAEDCPDHSRSGLALVDTGRFADWPIARLCEWQNAQFIVAARTAIPALLSEVERLHALVYMPKVLSDDADITFSDYAGRLLRRVSYLEAELATLKAELDVICTQRDSAFTRLNEVESFWKAAQGEVELLNATLKAGPQEGSWEWALTQMKAGKAVTRQNAGRMCFRGDGLLSHKLHRSYLEATDWQIVAEPASTEGE